MAQALVANEVYELSCKGRNVSPALEISNVFHCRISPTAAGAITATDQEMTNAFALQFKSALQPRVPVDYELQQVTSRNIVGATQILMPPPTANQHPAKKVFGVKGGINVTAWAGTNISLDNLPPMNAVSARIVLSVFSRYFRSGHRFGPVPEGDTVGSEHTQLGAGAGPLWTTAVSNMQAVMNIVGNATITFGGWSPSFYAWILPGASPVVDAFADAVAVLVSSWIGTQTTRRPPHNP